MDPPVAAGPRQRWEAVVVFGVFFFSGAAALVYEISWSRQMGLLFGHTAQAAAVVLAGYFAGLALGYLLAAGWTRRISPLVGYAVAELAAAGWACLIPWLLDLLRLAGIAGWAVDASPAIRSAMRAVVCLVVLLPATVSLGATLPMMAQYLWTSPRLAVWRVSLAYALNTAGAVVGVLSATAFMLVVVGVRASSYLAAGVSVACGIAALLVAAYQGAQSPSDCGEPADKADSNPTATEFTGLRLWLALAAVSGFVTLGLEVLYTRLFALVFHNSTYTFGAVVAVFLAALALAAAAVSILQRHVTAVRLIGWGSALGGFAAPAAVFCLVSLSRLEYFTSGDTFAEYLFGSLGLVALVVLAPVTLLGVVLPAAWKAAASSSGAGGAIVGRLTAANTLAAVAGSLAAGFVLMPALGLWRSFWLLSLLALAPAVVLLLRGKRRVEAGCLAAALLALLTMLDVELRQFNSVDTDAGQQLVRHWDGPYGWIDVVQATRPRRLVLRENVHYTHGASGPSATREYRQGHLPLLLHGNARDVLFLGLGTGLTASSALHHQSVERIDVVELIPQVVEAARLFAKTNHHVVDHPRVKVHVDDARHFLLATGRRYDCIISDLYVPWESKTGYLYTVEHFQAVRGRLKPGGLCCLWLGLYQVGEREFELIADSFATVFPETNLWWGRIATGQAMIVLLGSERPLTYDTAAIDARLERLRQATGSRDVYLRSASRLLEYYLGGWKVRSPGRLNTDEHPRVEFGTPISHQDDRLLTDQTLRAYFDEVLAHLPPDPLQVRPAAEETTPPAAERRILQRGMIN